MKRMITKLTVLTALTTLAGTAAAQAPAGASTDPADYAHLAVEDFQTAFGGPGDLGWPWDWYDQLITVGDVVYTGSVWPSTGMCIPGMDSDPYCGGDNIYLASSVDLHLTPQVPTSEIGFRYGTQGGAFYVTVTTSDGDQQQFMMGDDGPGSWWSGLTGFFGYATGDPAVTILDVHCTAVDGGIDDVRVGLADTGCSLESLVDEILALGLPRGLENSLLAKVDAAMAALDRGQTHTAINVLGALGHQLDAQRGKAIDAADADGLLDCVDTVIAELAG